jgi:hypothetical protein
MARICFVFGGVANTRCRQANPDYCYNKSGATTLARDLHEEVHIPENPENVE